MAKSDQDEAFEKGLTATLARVIDFVKFAETKNGILATLSSGWLIAILGIVATDKPVILQLQSAAIVATRFMFIACAICVVSFFPKVKLGEITRLKSTRHLPNLMYFGDIARLELDEFEKLVRSRYMPSKDRNFTDDYISDLSIQIAVTSRIAASKFGAFRWALGFASVALSILAVKSAAIIYGSWGA